MFEMLTKLSALFIDFFKKILKLQNFSYKIFISIVKSWN